jgi:hypothetical protein
MRPLSSAIRSLLQSGTRVTQSLSLRTRFLLSLWLLFFLLVALGIHGSSLPLTAKWWAPEITYQGYVADYLPGLAEQRRSAPDAWNDFMMATPREIRADEWLVNTPLELSQLSHNPPFPVVNTNIGNGQNMLVWVGMPVLHILCVARPFSWGYLLLGAQRGVAWAWWFHVFACFTALSLLMEVILRGRKKLAAFAALWFCGSAYVIAWSLGPCYAVFFPAMGCLAAYHLLKSDRLRVQLICAALLGLSFPGFLMLLYPAWQISLGYLFLFVFVGLFFRDKLYRKLAQHPARRLLALALSLIIAGGLTLEFLHVCGPALKAMAESAYPGNRRLSLGGQVDFWQIFKGMYNLITLYTSNAKLANQTEAASFYLLFPAVFFGLLISRKLRAGLGWVGLCLAGYVAAMVFFAKIGVTLGLSKLLLLRYVHPTRADIALGLGSIMLCVFILGRAKDLQAQPGGRFEKTAPLIAGIAVVPLFLSTGLMMQATTGGMPLSSVIVFVSMLAGLASFCMLSGKTNAFCGIVGASVIATSALFNPLSTNIDYLYQSELAQQIRRVDKEGGHPLWICYGWKEPGALVTALGARSLSGVQWPPQVELWRKLDPTGAEDFAYNRYAHVSMFYETDANKVTFANSEKDHLEVTVSPDHPALKAMGLRYILALDDQQFQVEPSKYPLIYSSKSGLFSIFEVRQSAARQGESRS